MKGTGLWWRCNLYTVGKWIAAAMKRSHLLANCPASGELITEAAKSHWVEASSGHTERRPLICTKFTYFIHTQRDALTDSGFDIGSDCPRHKSASPYTAHSSSQSSILALDHVHIVVGVVKMGTIAPRAGTKVASPVCLGFLMSPCYQLPTCLFGSLPERWLQSTAGNPFMRMRNVCVTYA